MRRNFKAAFILSGCGHMDGSEIREAVIALLELDRHNVEVSCFAPNDDQSTVKNHNNGEFMDERRNMLIESSRISRGGVQDLNSANAENFDMLIIPGGYGVIKNLTTSQPNSQKVSVIPALKNLIIDFFNNRKPIGAICIAPVIVVESLRDMVCAEVTIGDDHDNMIKSSGGKHIRCSTEESFHDKVNKIFSCSAYMRNDGLYQISLGIKHMIESLVKSLIK